VFVTCLVRALPWRSSQELIFTVRHAYCISCLLLWEVDLSASFSDYSLYDHDGFKGQKSCDVTGDGLLLPEQVHLHQWS